MGDYSEADLERDYYLGSYQTCISKANSMPTNKETIYYMCLSYCHTKKWDNLRRELDKAKSSSDIEDADKIFIELLTMFMEDVKSTEGGDPNCVKMLDSILSRQDDDGVKVLKDDDELARLLMSGLYARHKECIKALQVIDRFDSVRSSMAKISVYLMMHRQDLAEKQLTRMQKKEEHNPITELASAIVNLANSKPTLSWRSALSLTDLNRPSPLLQNIQTVSAICLGDLEFAKQLCESSLDMDNDNLEALINMIHILYKTRASAQIIERNLERLVDLYPNHEFVRQLGSIPTEICD